MNVLTPATLPELFLHLAKPGVRVLAGGTDLLVRLRSGRETAQTVVSLDRLDALRGISLLDEGTGQDSLRLGAACTHAELLAHPDISLRLPVLARALADLGSPPIRNMGTLGGNICTASPAADTLPPLIALGAEVEITSAPAQRIVTRRMPLAEFLLGPGRTVLTPGEVLTAVSVPLPTAASGKDSRCMQHFEKVGRRSALAVAVVSLAAVIHLDNRGVVTKARLAWGSVAPTIWRCKEAEAFLIGHKLTLTTLRSAAELVRQHVQPIGDIRASADYRREVAGNLLLRLVTL